MNNFLKDFLKDRHEAVIEAVINDKWTKVRAYCKKYGIPIPKNWKVMKAGIYKMAQYCTDIPDDVKNEAMVKCLELGFNPFIEEFGIPDTEKEQENDD